MSVGQNATNTFVVPVSNLPPSFTLFEAVNEQYSLVFTTAMDGKVSVNGQEIALQDAISAGLAKKRKDVYVLPLNDASKGRVSLGEVSLLFQFVAPLPRAAEVELPMEVKGGILKQIDQFFFMILAASLFIHFSGATFIACQPKVEERELTLDELPDRFVKAMMPVKVKPPPPAEVADNGAEETSRRKRRSPRRRPRRPPAPPEEGAAAGEGRAVRSAQDDRLLRRRRRVRRRARKLERRRRRRQRALGASGVGVATADSLAAGGPKGGSARSAAGIGESRHLGRRQRRPRREEADRGARRRLDAGPRSRSADVDREELAATCAAARPPSAVLREGAEAQPRLKGKVVVRFTITPAGRTSEIDIEENTLGNEAVASCIKTTIRGWVFPFKPPSEVPVAYPFVFAPAS